MGFFLPASAVEGFTRKVLTDEERKARDKAYRELPFVKARRKEYKKEYRQRPEVKARRKAYRQSPEGKVARKKERQTPKAKAAQKTYMKKYFQRPEIKARMNEYMNEYMKAYSKQPEVKARINKYMNAYCKRRKQTDPLFKLKTNLRARVLKALETYSKTGKIYKSGEYGIDYSKIIKHLGTPPAAPFNVHHIIPLCCFDFNNLKAIERAFAPENHAYTGIKEHEELHAELIKYGVQ